MIISNIFTVQIKDSHRDCPKSGIGYLPEVDTGYISVGCAPRRTVDGVQYHTWDTLCVYHTISESCIRHVNMI